MKYLLLSYVVLSIGVVISTDPKDVCDTCILKEKCQVFVNMNEEEQRAWLDKFPCASPEQSSLGSLPGFAAGAKGDYVCCSNKIWGSMSETEQPPQEPSQSLTQNKFSYPDYDYNDDFGNYNRPNYYSNAPRPNARNINQYPNNQYNPPPPFENNNPGQNFNTGNGRGSDSKRSPNEGKNNVNDRPNSRNTWWNSRNPNNNNNRPRNLNTQRPPYRTEGPGIPGPGNFNLGPGNFNQGSGNFNQGSGNFNQGSGNFNRGPGNFNKGPGRSQSSFNNNNQQTTPAASTNSSGNNSQGNSFSNFGQCDRVTSLPPDPQSGCCGREASDDDRITEPNAPTDIGYAPADNGNIPDGVRNSQIGAETPRTFNNLPPNIQDVPPNIVFLPNDVNNAPRVIDNGFGNGNVPIDTGYAPNTPINNGYPPNNNAPLDFGYVNTPIFGQAPNYGGPIGNNFNFPDENADWPLWMLKDKAQRQKRDDVAVNGTEVEIENRISGGKETELYQFPWTVLLITIFDYGTQQTAFNCGGSLISSKFVLTAGHCVYDKQGIIKNVEVYLAEYDKRTFPRDCKMTAQGRKCVDNIVMDAENVIRHPQYDDDGLQNDIALIKLRGNAPYTDYIRPICLTSINIDEPKYSNLRLSVAGWGRNGPYRTDIKQSTVVNLVPQNDCKRFYPNLNRRHLCAAGHKGEDTCKGDSGGPLMTLYRGKYYVVGVVSGKRSDTPCGTAVPSLYTNVYHYLDWIKTNVRN